MRNLITGIFAILAGTLFVGGRYWLNDENGKNAWDQIKSVRDSVNNQPPPKSPEPLDNQRVN